MKPIIPPQQKTKKTFQTYESSRHQGVLLLNQATLQEIYTRSGPAAISNEFQVHYYALVFRHIAADDSILDVAVPTVFFNYPQQVTSAHIDFELKDVKATSEKIRPVHTTQVTKLLGTSLQQQLEDLFNVKFTPVTSTVNSIHRHPGGSARQSFSGTDLDRTITEPGIVYPLTSGNLTPNFASIMAIDNGQCNLAHTEYRIVNSTESTTTYTEARCHSIALGVPIQLSTVERLLGQCKDTPYEIRAKNSALLETHNTALVSILQTTLLPLLLINPKHVTKKAISPSTFRYTSAGSWLKTPQLPGMSVKRPDVPKMYELSELEQLPLEKLYAAAHTIDDFFNLDYTDYSIYSRKDLVTTILEGYEEINDELAVREYDKIVMQEELLAIGVDKAILVNLTDEQLAKYHEEAYPE